MHKLKILSTPTYTLVPYTPDLPLEPNELTEGLLRVFSNPQVVQFNKNRELQSEEDVTKFIFTSTFDGYDNQTNYDYFLIDKTVNQLIGTIHLISPILVKNSYPDLNFIVNNDRFQDSTWTIEYYLDPDYWNKGIMGLFVKDIVNVLFSQGATYVCAITDIENERSIKLLLKLGFAQNIYYQDWQNQVLLVKSNAL